MPKPKRERARLDERFWLRRLDVCDYLSIGLNTLLPFIEFGDLRGVPIGTGNECRFRRSDVEQLAEAIAEGTTKYQKTLQGAK